MIAADVLGAAALAGVLLPVSVDDLPGPCLTAVTIAADSVPVETCVDSAGTVSW